MNKSELGDDKTTEKEENDILNEIGRYLIDDMILEFCFKAHKSLKLNYFDSFKSSKVNCCMSKLGDLQNPGPSFQMPSKRKSPVEKRDNVIDEFTTPSEIKFANEVIRSMEGSIQICQKCKKPAQGYDYVSLDEKSTDEKEPVKNANPSENMNSLDMLKIRIGDRYFYPKFYKSVKDFFYPGMDIPLLTKTDKEVETSRIKNTNKHIKTFDNSDKSTINLETDEDTVISSEIKNVVETAETLTDSMEIAFFCLECTNLKTFWDWLQFILLEHSKEENKLTKENKKTVEKTEMKKNGDTDIFGRSLKDLEKKINKMSCICLMCKRKVGACRYAAHLSNCMGHGRRKSKRLQS